MLFLKQGVILHLSPYTKRLGPFTYPWGSGVHGVRRVSPAVLLSESSDSPGGGGHPVEGPWVYTLRWCAVRDTDHKVLRQFQYVYVSGVRPSSLTPATIFNWWGRHRGVGIDSQVHLHLVRGSVTPCMANPQLPFVLVNIIESVPLLNCLGD